MAQLETDALVLDARPYRETSLLVSLLTRERGRVGAMVRGARRGKSSLVAALQPMTLLRVRLAMSARPDGGLATLASADIVWQPPFLHPLPQTTSAERAATLARMAYAGLFGEILMHGEEDDPFAAEVFDLSREFLVGLAAALHPGSHAVAGLFALLGALGFAPQMMDAPAASGASEAGVFHGVDLLEGTVASGFAGPPGARGERFVVLAAEEAAALAWLLENPGMGMANTGTGTNPWTNSSSEFVVGRRTGRRCCGWRCGFSRRIWSAGCAVQSSLKK